MGKQVTEGDRHDTGKRYSVRHEHNREDASGISATSKQEADMLRKMLGIVFATILVSLLPTLAMAEPCGERADFLEILLAEYGEAPISAGRGSGGEVFEVLASKNGTWTVIVTEFSGRTCVVDAGHAWLLPNDDIDLASNTSLTVAYDHLTTLEATPNKFVFSQPASVEELEEALRLSREHCKKFGLATGSPRNSHYGGSNPGVLTTVPCVIIKRSKYEYAPNYEDQ